MSPVGKRNDRLLHDPARCREAPWLLLHEGRRRRRFFTRLRDRGSDRPRSNCQAEERRTKIDGRHEFGVIFGVAHWYVHRVLRGTKMEDLCWYYSYKT